jgi:hypothetical protein
MHFLVATIFMIVSFVGTSVALAQSNGELLELARPILDAVMSGQWVLAAALALVLAVALLRRFGGSRWPVLSNPKVAPLLTILGAFGGMLATAILAGASVSTAMAWTALKAAFFASGGYHLAKLYLGDLPWIGALFQSKKRAEAAKQAGDAAVAANPSEGLPVDLTNIP